MSLSSFLWPKHELLRQGQGSCMRLTLHAGMKECISCVQVLVACVPPLKCISQVQIGRAIGVNPCIVA